MLLREFDTTSLARRDQFDCWLEHVNHEFFPIRIDASGGSGGFPARGRVLALEGMHVSALANPAVQATRNTKMIRRSDPEAYQVNFVSSGRTLIRQAGREALCGVGEFNLLNTSRPFDGWRSSNLDKPYVNLIFSRELLPMPAEHVDELLAVPIGTEHGIGAAFARWLTELTARAEEFTPAQIPTLASVTLELLAATLAVPLQAHDKLTPQARRRALRTQIHEFIDHHLDDPALTPRQIALAHHISLRTLQKLFTDADTTPAAWIRRRRLQRCHRDLIDARLASHPIHAIARRWGFSDAAHFSRLFHRTYGRTPSDHRHSGSPRE
ncbi:helix-turn-helix domain-containing protein [Nocardia abscessus]|uniref:helix-turn-helix domain-containing protein n=1 Tax=Nocardia abscessus TaxID=120957 RepID=UPI0024585DC0|nr:helix-turn-helix domain-containing protein [Nocardia abscessus]